jgi:DNA-binding transcriptional LysR family regulator
MVNLEWFRSFKAIYETGTLTGAAQALYISQPGISLHLSSLEAYTGYQLFERTPRKMRPTEKGKILYNYILEAITKLEDAEQHFHKTTEKDRPTISIGMCFETFQFTLEPFLPTFNFNVIIKFGDYPEMLADLDKGILDLIITPEKGDSREISYTPFFKEKIIVIGGSDIDKKALSQSIKKKNLDEIQHWLKQQIWYGTTGDMEHLRNFWHLNFGKRPDFKPNFIVPNMSSIIRCLSSGMGIAVIPDFLSRKELDAGRIQIIWEGFQRIENTLYFGRRKQTLYEKELNQVEEIFLKEMA